jgi:hypothetical protein
MIKNTGDMTNATVKIAPTKPTVNVPLTGQVDPRMYNPGVKPSGAPVPFNTSAQQAMVNMYGSPVEGSFDRRMATPNPPPVNVQTDITPNYDLTTI